MCSSKHVQPFLLLCALPLPTAWQLVVTAWFWLSPSAAVLAVPCEMHCRACF